MSDEELCKALRSALWGQGHHINIKAADRIEQLERERNDLLSFDDYFRSLCGFKRDGRDSKECLDDYLAELKRQDVVVPFDHLLLVAKERNEAEAKLAKAVERLTGMRDDQIGYRHAVHFRRGASVTLVELGEIK